MSDLSSGSMVMKALSGVHLVRWRIGSDEENIQALPSREVPRVEISCCTWVSDDVLGLDRSPYWLCTTQDRTKRFVPDSGFVKSEILCHGGRRSVEEHLDSVMSRRAAMSTSRSNGSLIESYCLDPDEVSISDTNAAVHVQPRVLCGSLLPFSQ